MCSFKRRFNKKHHYFIIIVFIEQHPNKKAVKSKIHTGMKESIPVTATDFINTAATATTTRSITVFSPPTPLIPIIPNVEGPPHLSPSTSDVTFAAIELNQSTTAVAAAATASLSVNKTGDEINSFYFYEVSCSARVISFDVFWLLKFSLIYLGFFSSWKEYLYRFMLFRY